jgi:hypothetical protein
VIVGSVLNSRRSGKMLACEFDQGRIHLGGSL